MIWLKYTSQTHDHDHWVLILIQGGVPKPGCKNKETVLYFIQNNLLTTYTVNAKSLKPNIVGLIVSIFNK